MDVDVVLSSMLKSLGEKIRQRRDAKGFTLEEMFAICDIDPSDFSKIERGKQNVTLKTIVKIAIALEMNPAELLKF